MPRYSRLRAVGSDPVDDAKTDLLSSGSDHSKSQTAPKLQVVTAGEEGPSTETGSGGTRKQHRRVISATEIIKKHLDSQKLQGQIPQETQQDPMPELFLGAPLETMDDTETKTWQTQWADALKKVQSLRSSGGRGTGTEWSGPAAETQRPKSFTTGQDSHSFGPRTSHPTVSSMNQWILFHRPPKKRDAPQSEEPSHFGTPARENKPAGVNAWKRFWLRGNGDGKRSHRSMTGALLPGRGAKSVTSFDTLASPLDDNTVGHRKSTGGVLQGRGARSVTTFDSPLDDYGNQIMAHRNSTGGALQGLGGKCVPAIHSLNSAFEDSVNETMANKSDAGAERQDRGMRSRTAFETLTSPLEDGGRGNLTMAQGMLQGRGSKIVAASEFPSHDSSTRKRVHRSSAGAMSQGRGLRSATTSESCFDDNDSGNGNEVVAPRNSPEGKVEGRGARSITTFISRLDASGNKAKANQSSAGGVQQGRGARIVTALDSLSIDSGSGLQSMVHKNSSGVLLQGRGARSITTFDTRVDEGNQSAHRNSPGGQQHGHGARKVTTYDPSVDNSGDQTMAHRNSSGVVFQCRGARSVTTFDSLLNDHRNSNSNQARNCAVCLHQGRARSGTTFGFPLDESGDANQSMAQRINPGNVMQGRGARSVISFDTPVDDSGDQITEHRKSIGGMQQGLRARILTTIDTLSSPLVNSGNDNQMLAPHKNSPKGVLEGRGARSVTSFDSPFYNSGNGSQSTTNTISPGVGRQGRGARSVATFDYPLDDIGNGNHTMVHTMSPSAVLQGRVARSVAIDSSLDDSGNQTMSHRNSPGGVLQGRGAKSVTTFDKSSFHPYDYGHQVTALTTQGRLSGHQITPDSFTHHVVLNHGDGQITPPSNGCRDESQSASKHPARPGRMQRTCSHRDSRHWGQENSESCYEQTIESNIAADNVVIPKPVMQKAISMREGGAHADAVTQMARAYTETDGVPGGIQPTTVECVGCGRGLGVIVQGNPGVEISFFCQGCRPSPLQWKHSTSENGMGRNMKGGIVQLCRKMLRLDKKAARTKT